MSNKKQLQQHNADLATALDNINGLPMADDVKHGVYAWGKYIGRTVDTVPSSIVETADMGNPAEFAVYKKINISNDIANGIDANTVYIYDMAGGEDITSAEYPYYIYNGIAYVDARISRNALYVQGNKIKTGKGEFIETVVSDISNKYPDKGEEDEYYYKKIHAENATEYGIFYNDVDSEGYPTDVKIVQENIPMSFLQQGTAYSYTFDKLKRLEIVTGKIYDFALNNALYRIDAPFKMKLKCYSIGKLAFQYMGDSERPSGSVWISSGCAIIDASDSYNGPFQTADGNIKLYCEVENKPSLWGTYWNYRNSSNLLTVTWGVTEKHFDEIGNV